MGAAPSPPLGGRGTWPPQSSGFPGKITRKNPLCWQRIPQRIGVGQRIGDPGSLGGRIADPNLAEWLQRIRGWHGEAREVGDAGEGCSFPCHRRIHWSHSAKLESAIMPPQ